MKEVDEPNPLKDLLVQMKTSREGVTTAAADVVGVEKDGRYLAHLFFFSFDHLNQADGSEERFSLTSTDLMASESRGEIRRMVGSLLFFSPHAKSSTPPIISSPR